MSSGYKLELMKANIVTTAKYILKSPTNMAKTDLTITEIPHKIGWSKTIEKTNLSNNIGKKKTIKYEEL